MKAKRWLIGELSSETDIASAILANRELNSEEIRRFLDVNLSDFSDFKLLADYEKTLTRIAQAVKEKQKIVIYGDYDVDGITSTSIMMLFLKQLNANVDYYIPNRFMEGYGLNGNALKKIASDGVDLVITVDCGITSIKEADLANELGLDLIITDHHNLTEQLPNAYAVVNPKRDDQEYPFKMLCGAGVAFMIAAAFVEENTPLYRDLLVLAMIGTIADIMPLISENRIIVAEGLKALKSTNLFGIKALMKVAGITTDCKSGQIGFQLAPRLNAAGRLENASLGVELILSQDESKALKLAEKLDSLNKARREQEKSILDKAQAQIAENPQCLASNFIVVWGDDWHEGVIGIVASRLKESYYLPAIVFSKNGDRMKASARSISDFSIYDALKKQGHLLEKFGGHQQAAGLSMDYNNLTDFIAGLSAYGKEYLTPELLTPKVRCESYINVKEINFDTIELLSKLAPFGVANPLPLFSLANLRVEAVRRIGSDGNHLKFSLSKSGKLFDALYFGYGQKLLPQNASRLDVVCQLELNHFRGVTSIQLMLKDMRSYDPYQNSLAKKWYIYYINKLLQLDFTKEFIKPLKLETRADVISFDSIDKTAFVVSSFEGLLELYYASYDKALDFETLLSSEQISLFSSSDDSMYYDLPLFARDKNYTVKQKFNDHDCLVREIARTKVDRRLFAALYRQIVKRECVDIYTLLANSEQVLLDSLALLFFEEAGFIQIKGETVFLIKEQHKKSEFNYSSTNQLYQSLKESICAMAIYLDRQKL